MADTGESRIAWWSVEQLFTDDPSEHRICETPKHLSSGIPSKWVMAVVSPDYPGGLVQGMCESCMGLITQSLGTTPEEGRSR